jgi:hypothetical protein
MLAAKARLHRQAWENVVASYNRADESGDAGFGGAMFAGWSNFYGMVGQAAATLIGLMFLIMQLGAALGGATGRRAREVGVRLFLPPTLVHFGTVFFIAMVALAPDGSAVADAVCLLVCGVAGLGYVTVIGAGMSSGASLIRPSDYGSQLAYVPLPAIAYLLIVASSVAALTRWPHASLTVGVATAILLSVGIRNAWDMALFVAGSSSDEKDATHRGSGQ